MLKTGSEASFEAWLEAVFKTVPETALEVRFK